MKPEDALRCRRVIVACIQEIASFVVENALSGALGPEGPVRVRERADELTRITLAHFQPGEEEIAWWTQVELYGGIAEPISLLRDGERVVDERGTLLFTPPRFSMLVDWADGKSAGPRYRGQDSSAPMNVDTLRERFVIPFSEAPDDMIWAPILDWRNDAAKHGRAAGQFEENE